MMPLTNDKKVLPLKKRPRVGRHHNGDDCSLPKLGSRRQQRFLMGVKLLLKSLQTSPRPIDQMVAHQVKETVKECVRQNRQGNKAAIPLQAKLETRLRELVGHEMYVRSMFLVDFYQARKQLRSLPRH